MKNLKSQFKLIIFFLLFLNFFNILEAKNIDKFYNSKDLSSYFSGIIAINDNQYQDSYDYFKTLNNLEESHYTYSQYYLQSLVKLKKFKEANNYSKELEEKNLENFESSLVSAIYYLKNENLSQARVYFKKLINKNQPGSIQNLLSVSLNSWSTFDDLNDIDLALSSLKSIPSRFENIKNIQEVFTYCFFESEYTDEFFRKLTINPKINYSRYHFFHANYLMQNKKNKQAKDILRSSLNTFPKSLILNQLETDLSQNDKINDQFNCQNSNHVIAEILYTVANGLSAQANYVASNFYINLAKYLNPNFLSYEVRHVDNFETLEQYSEAIKIYEAMKKKGSNYRWHASKRITSILKKQEKKEDAIKYLKGSFLKIKNPTIYEIFDYAEFLKNNDLYKESIKYYSKLINLIDQKHNLYGQVLDGRGVAYERTDQWDKAQIDLLNSLSITPNDAYVINYLAYSWIEKGVNIEKSLKMLLKANQLKPNDAYIIDSLGWALFKLKRYKEAKKYLELAVRLMASDPVVNDHYADALWMNNNSLQARYYWNYVLKLKKAEKNLKEKIRQKLLFGLKISIDNDKILF